MSESRLRDVDIFEAPFIKVVATIIQPGSKNGKSNIPNPQYTKTTKYCLPPSAIKIARYIVNQIFGSDLVTQTEGLSINWLMPTLKSALRDAIYQSESFVYIHKYDNKIYLENIMKTQIHNLVQRWDKVISGTIIQDITGDEEDYVLVRDFKLENGKTYLKLTAFIKDKQGREKNISMDAFNHRTGYEYEANYVLPYEAIINIDVGEKFFKDSEKFLNEEMNILNVIANEIQKTQTRIVTSQHYQTGDIVAKWTPGTTSFNVETLSVGNLQDYFTLLPGDKEHAVFEFLQGEVRIQPYIDTFKFYDYQVIQQAGLSPVSFGYEKDAYMNVANVDVSKSSSEMSIEAIKTQIEPQINKLIANVVKAQRSSNITENILIKSENEDEFIWDYGDNTKVNDENKLALLEKVLNVAEIPYKIKAEIILPMLKKIIDKDYSDTLDIDKFLKEYEKETKAIDINYGEI